MIKSLIAGITLTGAVLAAPSPQQSPDIVDVAMEAGSFSTLIAAVGFSPRPTRPSLRSPRLTSTLSWPTRKL
jgi:hypothetical protein